MSAAHIISGISNRVVPGLGMKKLAVWSNSSDPVLRAKAADTLRAKIENGFSPSYFNTMNRSVMIDALAKADVLGMGLWMSSGERDFVLAVQKIVKGCSAEELGKLSNSNNPVVFSTVQEIAAPLAGEIIQGSFARYLAIFTPKSGVIKQSGWFCRTYIPVNIDWAEQQLSKVFYKGDPGETYTGNAIVHELAGINPVLSGLVKVNPPRACSPTP